MTTKSNIIRSILALVAVIALVSLAACGAGSDGDADLGINKDLGPRENPAGEELSGDYHPLSKNYRTLAPLSELYFAGIQVGEVNQGLLDDSKADNALLYTDENGEWVTLKSAGTRGDLDGDGFDEIAVLYHVPADSALKLKVIDRNGDTYEKSEKTVLTGVEPLPESEASFPMAMASGDFDGDGKDELVVSWGDMVLMLDDAANGHSVMGSVSYPAAAGAEATYISIAVGDFNGDGRDQLYVLHSQYGEGAGKVSYYRYDGALDEEIDNGQLVLNTGLDTYIPALAKAAAGDVDGDGLDEIAIRGLGFNSSFVTVVLDDERAEFAQGKVLVETAPMAFLVLELLDYNGDGVKDVLSGDRIYGYNNDTQELSERVNLGGGLPLLMAGLVPRVAVGDFDADLKEDVAMFIMNGIHIHGMDLEGEFVLRKSIPAAPAGSTYPILVSANTDHDSLVVRFTGNKELLFSKPQVLAVMAAPPAYAGKNVEGSSTTFGRISGNESDTTHAFGFTAGVSVGYEQDISVFGVEVGGVSFKASLETAMDWSTMTSASRETSVAYTSGSGEDKVVFTAIPYDVYYYEVVSAPDASAVGTILSINVPREPQTLSVSRSYYNAHNGDAPDIDNSVLGHKIGDPWSYPTTAERDSLMDGQGWINPDSMVVGEGNGETTLTVSATEGKGTGYNMDINASVEVEGKVMGVTAGVSAGFHYGLEINAHAYTGLFLEGTIADIPGDAERYRAGIFAYPHTHMGQTFIVVNYWVAE